MNEQYQSERALSSHSEGLDNYIVMIIQRVEILMSECVAMDNYVKRKLRGIVKIGGSKSGHGGKYRRVMHGLEHLKFRHVLQAHTVS
jgi:hypothetical protein